MLPLSYLLSTFARINSMKNMDSNRIKKLENNIKLKKRIFSKNIWKNYAFLPPSLMLFAGIVGLVYLFKMDYLLTLYSIPFIIIFFIGTVWFKSTKRYLINKRISEADSFKVCMCLPVTAENKKQVYMFSIGNNRNNKYYLEEEKKDLLEKKDNSYFFNNNDKIFKLDDTDICILIVDSVKKSATKKYQIDGVSWLLYFGNQNFTFLSSDLVNRYS